MEGFSTPQSNKRIATVLCSHAVGLQSCCSTPPGSPHFGLCWATGLCWITAPRWIHAPPPPGSSPLRPCWALAPSCIHSPLGPPPLGTCWIHAPLGLLLLGLHWIHTPPGPLPLNPHLSVSAGPQLCMGQLDTCPPGFLPTEPCRIHAPPGHPALGLPWIHTPPGSPAP
jgi:hypothetical protein